MCEYTLRHTLFRVLDTRHSDLWLQAWANFEDALNKHIEERVNEELRHYRLEYNTDDY